VSEVNYEVQGGVAHVELNAPKRRNALTPDMADELAAAFAVANADTRIGAVVISGAEGSFCAGADLLSLDGVMQDPTTDAAYRSVNRIYSAFLQAGALEVPSIAAIRGPVVGAGINLAFATDVRVAADNARFISGFEKLGLHPGGGHFSLLSHAASPEVAAAMAIFAQEVSGARAAELGLVWEALDDAAVEDRAFQMAARAGADPALARYSVKSLRMTTGANSVSWPAAVQAERAPQLWSLRRAGQRMEAQ